MNPKMMRQVVHIERMTIARILLRQGAVVAMQHHESEQMTMLKSGLAVVCVRRQ